jgi:ABC-type phosphate/phosphonate transport system substrate-binding protein
MKRVAALPMYDFPWLQNANDTLWAALRREMIGVGMIETPQRLTRHLAHFEVWMHPLLLFGQACEYPLAESPADSVRLIATPRYSAPGCEGTRYRSAIMVRKRDSAERLADLRDRRCAINEASSNSGMNLLRASIAPLAQGGSFFGSVLFSGSHLTSVQMVSEGEADVAAIDCVSLAHFHRLLPSAVADLRILDWTPSSPSLPFITSAATSDATLEKLRSSLAAVLADKTLDSVRERLFLEGVDLEPVATFAEVLRLKRSAVELGYPAIH